MNLEKRSTIPFWALLLKEQALLKLGLSLRHPSFYPPVCGTTTSENITLPAWLLNFTHRLSGNGYGKKQSN